MRSPRFWLERAPVVADNLVNFSSSLAVRNVDFGGGGSEGGGSGPIARNRKVAERESHVPDVSTVKTAIMGWHVPFVAVMI